MELKALGSSGVMIPEIGLGFWNYHGGAQPIQKGLELGAFFLDTAEVYGTEEIIGRAIEGSRDRAFIASKVSRVNLAYDDVLRAAEASLRRLRTSVIDLYQIHSPNPAIPIKETMRAMETLVDRGLIRFIGVSNFSCPDLRVAQAVMRNHPIVSNQVHYNLSFRWIEADLLPYSQKHQITIIAFAPLDVGRLAASPSLESSRSMRTLVEIGREVNRTPGQVALNWCISHPNVIAIPKSNRVDRTIENCLASGWRLSRAQIRRLNAAFSWHIGWMRAKAGRLRRRMLGEELSILNQQTDG
jgi:diketogulonate reductase-like aldo/keto reductase